MTLAKDEFEGYGAEVSASFAPAIVENISELQKVLLEGLIAVLVIGSIVIALRASLITVLSMVTVILSTIALLYLLGYTLNVITLFGLILGLSLIVDDTIIMVEAIEAARRKTKTAKEAVALATRKVSRAMVAATVTAALCFLPLALVGGVLGSFIRAIPVTIISSLLISLVVALVFIPFFARFLLLTKKEFRKARKPTVGSRVENFLANGILKPMRWAEKSRRKLVAVGITAIIIAFGFIGAGLGLAQKVTFNIFPPTKDTNGIIVTLKYPEGTNLANAKKIASDAETVAANVVGENFVQATYYANGTPQMASVLIELTPYGKREITSPQLIDQLKNKYNADFKTAQVTVGSVDLGPPIAAFNVQIKADDRQAAYNLADDLKTFLATKELERLDGSKARFTDVAVSSQDEYIRSDKGLTVQLGTGFDGDDITTLVTLAQTAINDKFDAAELKKYDLPADAISFDLGQETENQDSFKTLAVTFPLLLLAIYILLILEFRSLLQPLLIFMAIPFSIFGLMLGLYLTDNAISFFASLGFFALIGLSIKNTILLTDFANQARASGLTAVDSAAAAVQERFRPLVATSLTAIFSLIPLAITSPFWQGLAVVLIFGLASSTILVLLVFPYFYLGVEYLRVHVSRRLGLAWLVTTVAVTLLIGRFVSPQLAPLFFLVSLLALFIWALLQKPRYAISK
jgi:HAE1 family hydrophobic/amphiphilic exporter-1